MAPACTTGPLPAAATGTGGEAAVVDADTLHRVELAALADRFAVVAARQADIPD
ncbi:hypothetical protein [Caenispirillum bisanense]|uniref:hypothetical protein n=1 Tax=Caenispirillum bisanense TaxID=414052 RepID=UPI0031E39AF6